MTFKTRKPTGLVPYPMILLEGEEKAGKTYNAFLLAQSDKVGSVYWMDLGEADADRYGAEAEYSIIDHNGQYDGPDGMLAQLKAACAETGTTNGKPDLLIVDSLSSLWSHLVDRAQDTADKRGGRKQITMDLWNKAKREWRAFSDELMRYPGIIVATARGKEVAEVDNGKPTGRKVWSVEAEKSLPYDVDAWVRFTRADPPAILGCRSLKMKMRPSDRPKPMPNFTLEHLIWDVLGCGGAAGVRQLPKVEPPKWPELNEQLTTALNAIGIGEEDGDLFRQYLADKCKVGSWADTQDSHVSAAISRVETNGVDWVRECILEATPVNEEQA